MFEEEQPPIERSPIQKAEIEPFEEVLSRFGQYFARDRAVGQQQFDPASLQELWMKWQEQAAMQGQEQSIAGAKENMLKEMRSYGQQPQQQSQVSQLPQPAVAGVQL